MLAEKPPEISQNPGHVFAMIIILFVLTVFKDKHIDKEMNIDSIKQISKQTNSLHRKNQNNQE